LDSRIQRRQYKREAVVSSDPYQSRIEDCFKFVEKLDEVIQLRNLNESLKSKLRVMGAKFNALQSTSQEESNQSLLKRMMNQAMKQAGKKPRGFRHDDPVLEHFCLNIWIGGRRL
jgi:urease accessory protein UreF